MKAKRFILMLLVILGSVTGAWAGTVIDYSIENWSEVLRNEIYNIKGSDGDCGFITNPGYVIVDTQEATKLAYYKIYPGGESTTYKNVKWSKVEGSNDQTEWEVLQSGDVYFIDSNPTDIYVSSTNSYRYYRFTFVPRDGAHKGAVVKQLVLFNSDLNGHGTASDPYLVTNAMDMLQLAKIISKNPESYIKITANLDMSDIEWTPLDNSAFRGVIDGDGHIVMNLTANGLFRNIGAATIKNLTIENATLTATDEYDGSLVAQANGTIFQNCIVKGTFSANSTNVGGLVGNANGATFAKCYSVGNFSVEGTNCGGLVGVASNNTQLTQCYSVTNLDKTEIRPTYEDGSPVPNNNTTPPNLLVDAAGTSTKWCDHIASGLYIIVSTGDACKLQSIKLWNGGDTGSRTGRRWKDVKVYGSSSAEGPWDEDALIKSFTNLELAANNSGFAGELPVNATEEYKYYKIEVLSTMGESLQQMSDMKFVVTPQSLQLPVCGASDGSCTATHCYHYGSTSSNLSNPVEKADVASGRLAYLLNGCVDFAITGPYYQKLGTDMYPVLTGTNYVYRSRDGNSYTNTCPHNNPTLVAAYKPLTCIADGNAAYYHCKNSVCKKYILENGGQTTSQEAILSRKPVIVTNHTYENYPGLGYAENLTIQETKYYNVTTLYTKQDPNLRGDYIVTYTNLSDVSTMKFHEFCNFEGSWAVSQTIRYYVNGVERTEWRKTLNNDYKHREILLDNLKKYDIIKIVYNYNTMVISTGTIKLYIAQEQPTGWDGKHHFHQVAATYDCIEGGYDQHYECEICKNAFSSNADTNSDDNLAPLSTFYHEPLPGGHAFALSDQLTDEGLLKYTCQTANCKAHDPSRFVIPNCVGTTAVEVTTDGETYTAVESNLTIEDGNGYNAPVPFATESLEYQRTFYTNVWNPWFVPFTTSVEELAENGVTDVACIESIHNYDTDMDGVVDKTVLEVIQKKAGTLKAGVPYMVKTGNSYAYPMNFTDMVLNASTDTKTVHTETGSAAYDFIGTYSGLTADEVNAASIFSLNSVGAMVHRTGEILPQRWYMKEVGKENIYEELSPAMARAISIRMIGEEDETTGIRTIYTEDRQTEELLPNGIFDLSGHKLSTPQSGQINIINGKKQFVK